MHPLGGGFPVKNTLCCPGSASKKPRGPSLPSQRGSVLLPWHKYPLSLHIPSSPALHKDAVMETESSQGGHWAWGSWWERDWLGLLMRSPCVAAGHPPLLLGLRARGETHLHQAHGHAGETAKAQPSPFPPWALLEVGGVSLTCPCPSFPVLAGSSACTPQDPTVTAGWLALAVGEHGDKLWVY